MTQTDKADLKDIYDSFINGQKKQAVKQIDSYGVWRFFKDYRDMLHDIMLFDNEQANGYVTEAAITYHYIKASESPEPQTANQYYEIGDTLTDTAKRAKEILDGKSPEIRKGSHVKELKLGYHNPAVKIQKRKISGSDQVVEVLRAIYAIEETANYRETFICLHLNRYNMVDGYSIISQGSGIGTVVDPKMVFQHALIAGAQGIIVAHNHPSGNLRPSGADNRLTKDLVSLGKTMQMPVIDHVIVSGDLSDSYSYADNSAL